MTWNCLGQDDLITRKWAKEAKKLSLVDWFIQDLQYSSHMAKTNATIWSLRTLIDSSGACSNHYAYAWQKNTMTRKHYRGDVEYFAVYSPDTDKVYLIPIDHVGTTQARLRLVPTANNQEKNVRWAQDYEL